MPNLLQNGSFETVSSTATNNGDWFGSTVLPGWTLQGLPQAGVNWFESVSSGHRGVIAVAGTRYLDTDATNNNITFSQAVANVSVEKTYRVTVTLASSVAGNGVDVFWGGQKLGNAAASSSVMETVTFLVTGHADAAQNVLKFAGTGVADSVGAYIDQVWMEEVSQVVQTPTGEDFAINAIHNGTAGVDTYHIDATPGRQFFVDFDLKKDVVNIAADVATSWADLQRKANIYQSEGSAVVEFYNGQDTLVFTQTQVSELTHRIFVFEATPAADAATTGGNLIRNGSFENVAGAQRTGWGFHNLSTEGWNLSGTPHAGVNRFEMVSSGHRNVSSSDGQFWLDMDASAGNITAWQTVQGVEAGRYYTIKIDAANSGGADNIVKVMWDGQLIGTIAPTSRTMQTYSYVVEGHSGADMNRLALVGQGNVDSVGVSLDNVRVLAHLGAEPQPDIFNFGLGDGRVYVTEFQPGFDKIAVRSDLASSFDDLMSQAVVYQDGLTTIIEFNNGHELLILPQFAVENLSADMFTFSKPLRSTEMLSEKKFRDGTEGDDHIIVGAGDQFIDGGAGFDVITTGLGADVIGFNRKSGHDFITDFDGSQDRILISQDLAESFDHLMKYGAIYQDGKSTQIEFADGQLITLYGVEASTVQADWFLFS